MNRTRLKIVVIHAFECSMWFLVPLTNSVIVICLLYSAYRALSFLTAILLTFVIHGSLSETEIRDVTARRSAISGISIVVGFATGTFLIGFLPAEYKFTHVLSLGATSGLFSVLLASSMNLSHLEEMKLPQRALEPEKVFSSSLSFSVMLISANLLGIAWTPYFMRDLYGPDYLVPLMALAGTLSSVVASLALGKRSLKTLRTALALNSLVPILVSLTPWPIMHIPIRAYSAFAFTGANFLGTFLFARYNEWLGAVRSSIILVVLANLAQLVAAFLGLLVKENYFVMFLMIFVVGTVAVVVTFFAIPEVAVVPEDAARAYSRVLYNGTLLEYRMATEYSRETLLGTLRVLAASLVAVVLYVIYRILWILAG